MRLRLYPLYFICVTLLVGCATYEPQYREISEQYLYPTDKTLEKTFYLVGDAGYSPVGGMSTGLQVFQQFLKNKKTKGEYAIFLGDNIYPDGMPAVSAPDRKTTECRLDAQINSVENFEGQVYFIPGNHDWYNEGLVGLKRQENYFEEKLRDRNVFQPTNGCPLKSVSVSENIQLIMIDSQWYLENWNIHPNINEFCEIKTREKFFIELELELEKHKNKTILFTMHHPMFTNGTHGGYFGANKHLYPTQKKLPLPGLASLVAQIRSQGGVSVQDRYNELSNIFMNKLAVVAKKHGKLVFASGHEHTLQHIEQDGLIQILSGSGAKSGFAALGKDGLFSYGGQGFAVYDVFTDGSSYVRYYGADNEMQPKLLFEKSIFPPTKTTDVSAIDVTFPKKITTPIYKQDSLQEALFFKTIWGKKYEKTYATPIKANVAVLDSMYGGLRVIRDNNTDDYKSLLLEDPAGNLYNMRALKKQALRYENSRDISNLNPKNPNVKLQQNSDLAGNEDYGSEFYTASHPYALLAIPTLADTIKLFNNRPNLVYVPKQRTLQEYNEDFGDELYYISVAPSENNEGDRIFQYARDIETTDDILLKLRQRGNVKIDEETYIKTRLFDMLIGDWDKEPGHWRWALQYTRGKDSVYVPIARNRDHAFASLDGDILDVARSIFGSSNQRHTYTDNLADLAWFNSEGIILDRALLQKSNLNQWQSVATQLQETLTDALIDKAFENVPIETQDDESLDEVVATLKARRDNLLDIAERYFNFYNKLRTIAGTDGANYFEIERLVDGATVVREYDFSSGSKGTLDKEVTFNKSSTKQLWVYGLDGDDVFEVKGAAQNNMLVRLIGGHGNDTYTIENGKNIRVYDHLSKPNTVNKKGGALVRFTDLYTLNTYDYRKQIRSENTFVANTGYNPDDGMRVGLQYIRELNGFSRNPFSRQHRVNAGYYFDTNSFDVAYQGEIANLYKTFNLNFGARFTSPNYIYNYFGYGNETTNSDAIVGFDANRVEVQTISANVGLVRNSFFGSFFKAQFRADAVAVNSAITGIANPTNTASLDETNFYGTVEGIYSYRSFDDARNPSRGMLFDLTLGATDNLGDVSRLFGFLKTRMGFYNSLVGNEKLVLKTNVQGNFNFGHKFDFHQGVTLGANEGLRGFRTRRFTGKSSLIGSADVRYSFDEFRIELFPIQIGIYGGADLGRVWTPSGRSEQWHNSFGGGLWANGRGGFSAAASVFRSTEDTRVVFGLSFGF